MAWACIPFFHEWGIWEIMYFSHVDGLIKQFRTCQNCGKIETRYP